MRKVAIPFVILAVITTIGCRTTRENITTTTPQVDVVAAGKVLTAVFQQKAAEYRALCYQAYNFATVSLDQFLQERGSKPPAIMTDVDETVLDNSPYQVHRSLMGLDFEQESWFEWTSRAEADTVPGALGFLKYAASRGVEIFYVTNREEREREATLVNLKKFGFPYADNEHLKLKGATSSKVARRDSIEMHFNLLMCVGDNLNDMSGEYEKKTTAQRFAQTNKDLSAFGRRYIVLPNPSYGEWENAVYQYNFSLTPAQKDSIFRAVLQNYPY
ncbi:MAG: 5'-nucleotidase, lipoprotein e(P4) family [Chitinophagaceae bacterium]|nr:5'-nucleotidase, lipoprotein e(P4) family [Chitinophagaceae bacterium]